MQDARWHRQAPLQARAISPAMKATLLQVYLMQAICHVSAIGGKIIGKTEILHAYAMLGVTMALVLALYCVPARPAGPKLGMLLMATCSMGVCAGPTTAKALQEDPTRLVPTTVISLLLFTGLTLNAIYADRGSYLNVTRSLLGMLGCTRFAIWILSNVFYYVFGSSGDWGIAGAYMSFMVFALKTLGDTQKVVENAGAGNDTIMMDSFCLFMGLEGLSFWLITH